jgi:hypothetical protein
VWLGTEAVVFSRVGKQGLVLVQRNAWSAWSHEFERVGPAALQPLDTAGSAGSGGPDLT